MAEGAVQSAADLAGHAESTCLADIGNIDALAFDAGAEAGQPFLRAITRDLVICNLGPGEDEFLAQLRAQVLGDIGHAVKFLNTEMVHPAAQLFCAHASFLRLQTKRFHLCFQSRKGQARQ